MKENKVSQKGYRIVQTTTTLRLIQATVEKKNRYLHEARTSNNKKRVSYDHAIEQQQNSFKITWTGHFLLFTEPLGHLASFPGEAVGHPGHCETPAASSCHGR